MNQSKIVKWLRAEARYCEREAKHDAKCQLYAEAVEMDALATAYNLLAETIVKKWKDFS